MNLLDMACIYGLGLIVVQFCILCRLLFRTAKMQQDLMQAEERVKRVKDE